MDFVKRTLRKLIDKTVARNLSVTSLRGLYQPNFKVLFDKKKKGEDT